MNWRSRLFRRKQMEVELEKELGFHLDQHAADLVAQGHSPEEARRLARIALGGPEQVKESCRDARGTAWLEDLAQDVRYALRTCRNNPGFALLTVVIWALGIGATTIMFAVVNSVLLRPLAFPEPENLVTLHGFTLDFGEFWGFSNPDLTDLKDGSHSLAIAAWTYGGGTISAPGTPEYVDGRKITAELFAVLGVVPLRGRAFQADEDHRGAPPVAIISYSLWQRRFGGKPSATGSTMVFEGKSYFIAGIAPRSFQLSGEADVYTPLGQDPDVRMQNRRAHFIHVLARLQPGVNLDQARSELTLVASRLAAQYPQTNEGLAMRLQPLQQDLVGDVRTSLLLLLAAVGLVLFVACANIASLLLTRGISREREMAMRVALGARRGRVIRQCLTESALLGLSGGALGILLGKIGLRPFVAFWPGGLPRSDEIHLDWRVLAFAGAVSLISGLGSGIAPALRIPLHRLDQVLRAGGRAIAGDSRRLHSALIVSEIALTFVLLVSAGMLGHSLVKLSSLDPGLNVHNVLTARFAMSPAVLANPEQIRSAWRDVLDRVRRLPDVQHAALTDIVPMREGENSLAYRSTAAPLPPNQEPIALASSVTADYLDVMGIPLRAGRFFNQYDREGSEPVVVIDENLARHAFGGRDAVGKYLWVPSLGSDPVRIVGVVGHVRHWGLAGDDQSRVRDQMYYPFFQVPVRLLRFFSTIMSITVRTRTAPIALVAPLQSELRGAAGDQALYEPRTMEYLVSASLSRQRFLLLLFATFAGLALLLASIGIYGVLAYLMGQRVPEFGLRMALGANARDVMGIVVRQSLRLVGAGLIIGILVALAVGRILQRLVQGMQPANLATVAIVISVLAAAALSATLVPARRASLVDPASALRRE
jgi:predicted permease